MMDLLNWVFYFYKKFILITFKNKLPGTILKIISVKTEMKLLCFMILSEIIKGITFYQWNKIHKMYAFHIFMRDIFMCISNEIQHVFKIGNKLE